MWFLFGELSSSSGCLGWATLFYCGTPKAFHIIILVPADKAANNVVVVCSLHYINTLKQELNGTKAYEETSIDEKSAVNSHSNDMPYKFTVNVRNDLTNFLRCIGYQSFTKTYKARFIANFSSRTTTEPSKLLTSCLTAVKSHVIRYYETIYKNTRKICFGL